MRRGRQSFLGPPAAPCGRSYKYESTHRRSAACRRARLEGAARQRAGKSLRRGRGAPAHRGRTGPGPHGGRPLRPARGGGGQGAPFPGGPHPRAGAVGAGPQGAGRLSRRAEGRGGAHPPQGGGHRHQPRLDLCRPAGRTARRAPGGAKEKKKKKNSQDWNHSVIFYPPIDIDKHMSHRYNRVAARKRAKWMYMFVFERSKTT